MFRPFLAIVVLAALLLIGCATPIPLNNISYSGKVSVSSGRTATVNIISGAVYGSGSSTFMPVGKIFVPISSGPVPRLQFRAEDQRAFGESSTLLPLLLTFGLM